MKPGGRIYPSILAALVLFSLSVAAQNPKVDGYRGIWYSTGPENEYGFKLSGGVATFGSRHRPTAIYAPEVKKHFLFMAAPDNLKRVIFLLWLPLTTT